jgi:hypothetical protein
VTLDDGTKIMTKLLVDSGASHGLMLEPSTDDRIKVPQNYVSSSIGRGLGGDIIGKVGRIKALTFGQYKMENVVVRFPDPNSYFDSLKMGSTPRNGAIGGEVLSRFTIIYNFPKEEIYIKKNSSLRKGFHFNLRGLNVKAKGSGLGIFEITDVRKNSPGDEGGIQVGDQVISINGIGLKDLNLSIINGFFNYRPGKKIRMEVSRNGTIIRTRFQLKDEI